VDEEIFASFNKCLLPLLRSLNWSGSQRQLSESLPYLSQIENSIMFCDVLDNLGYSSDSVFINLTQLDRRLLPCLFVSEKQSPMLLLRIDDKRLVVFDGNSGKERMLSAEEEKSLAGQACVFKKKSEDEINKKTQEGWLRGIFKKSKGLIYSAIFLSFFINLFALATPIFIMVAYNSIIGVRSIEMLGTFLIGVVLAFAGYYIFYQMRSKILAVIGARLNREIGNKIFERILYMEPSYTEAASVGSQVSRIKDFDQLKSFLTGPAIIAVFDLPFIFFGIVVVALIGANLVIIPIVLVFLYVLVTVIVRYKMNRLNRVSSSFASHRQEFILESIKNIRVLKYLSLEKKWQDRFRDISADVSISNSKVSIINATNSSISEILMIGSGMAILAAGAIKVINNSLSIGAMLAIMILIWRIVAPLKTLFLMMPKLLQIENSVRQINRLMYITPESAPFSNIKIRKKINAKVDFSHITFQYSSQLDPALLDVSFKINPGELIGVFGENGSGKSTLLKLLLGLYKPQAGVIRIDDRDIRQIDSIELRHSIAYLSQTPELFYGTIHSNLIAAKPEASDEELNQAASQAGILDTILSMPDKFDTQIKNYSNLTLSKGFQQGLCLARAYLRKSPILLLDEPAALLDDNTNKQLIKTLRNNRGEITTLLVTHDFHHLEQTDKILVLRRGRLIKFGESTELLPKIFPR